MLSVNDDENASVITLLDSEDTDKEHEILFFKRIDCHEITLEELVLSDNAKLIPYEKSHVLRWKFMVTQYQQVRSVKLMQLVMS